MNESEGNVGVEHSQTLKILSLDIKVVQKFDKPNKKMAVIYLQR